MYVFYETTTITTSLLRTISLLGLSYFGKGSFLLSSRKSETEKTEIERERERDAGRKRAGGNKCRKTWLG